MVVALWSECTVFELRRYTLRPGRRPDLIAVFEQYLVEPQEECGMVVGGTFTDDDDPDSFVWWRGFVDHSARTRALGAFYGGPVWARHAGTANDTMVDSDDVLLLRSTRPAHAPRPAVARGAAGDRSRSERVLVGAVGVSDGEADSVEMWFATSVHPRLEDVLGVRVATWRTDATPNGFPRLPVRAERAVVWMAVFADDALRDAATRRLAESGIGQELTRRAHWVRDLRLTPTARSAHPGATGAYPLSPGAGHRAGR